MIPRALRTSPWLLAASVFGVALTAYALTAAQGLTWAHDSADGGDLITAALVGGVAHPTGYPTFLLLARVFTHLPWGAAAWRVTMMSAVCGALAATLVALTVLEFTAKAGPAGMGFRQGWLPALAAGLSLAFTTLLWGQATVTEVYALHACLAAALLWTLTRWQRGHSLRWAAGAGLVLGVALGNHLSSVWLLPLAISWLAGGKARTAPWGRFLLGLLAGLLVYAYLPLAAAGNPAVNWGDARTWEGFRWLVSGQLYWPFALSVTWSEVLGRVPAWAALLWRDWQPWGITLALAGLGLAFQEERLAATGTVLSVLLSLAWAAGYNTSDSLLTLLPGWVVIAIWLGIGLSAVVGQAATRLKRLALPAVSLLCLAIPLVPLYVNWPTQDLRSDHQAEAFVARVLTDAAPGALVITAGDRATFSLWYARYGLSRRPDLVLVSRDLWPLATYRATTRHNHPQLASAEVPQALAELLQWAVARGPVYLAQVGPPDGLRAVGLDESAPYRLEPVSAVPSDTPVLWRLIDVRSGAAGNGCALTCQEVQLVVGYNHD